MRHAPVCSVALIAMLGVGAATVPANAAEWGPREARPLPSPANDRFAIRGTYYRGDIDTLFRLDPGTGVPGTLLSAEDDLGLDDALDQGRMELYIRFGERGRVRVDYFKANRSAETVLERDIDFGGETFLVGENVASELDFRSLAFTWTYSFLRRPDWEIGAGLGVHLLEVQASGEAVDRFDREEESGIAPFPTVALDGNWRFARRWSVTGRAQHLSASVDDVDGSLSEYHVDVQYRWKPNFSIGLGYTYFDVDVEVADSDFPGLFRLTTEGPELFLRASF